MPGMQYFSYKNEEHPNNCAKLLYVPQISKRTNAFIKSD